MHKTAHKLDENYLLIIGAKSIGKKLRLPNSEILYLFLNKVIYISNNKQFP